MFHIENPQTCERLVQKATTLAFSHRSPGVTFRVALGGGVNTTDDVYTGIHSLFTKEPRSSLPGAWTPALLGRALGSAGGARPCCCWSRACSACCRCCGPRCCSRRPAGRWGPAAFLQSPLQSVKKGGEERHVMRVSVPERPFLPLPLYLLFSIVGRSN